MKFSFVVPVYNGEGTIVECVEALVGQVYPEEDFEVLVVNDGSTDNTKKLLEKFSSKIRLINLEKNSGRVVARETGAHAARHELLFFIDSRVIVEPDVLEKAAKIGYQPLGGCEWRQEEMKYKSPFDALFYLILRKVYPSYFPQHKHPDKMPCYYIEEDNFDQCPKGTTDFLVDRNLFLRASKSIEKGKNVSDDTKLLKYIAREKKILTHFDVKVTYIQRKSFWEVMNHMFNRGPKFTHYYLVKGGAYRKFYFLGLSVVFLLIATTILYPGLLVAELFVLIFIFVGISIWMSENIRDFLIVSVYFPPVLLAFTAGVIKGLFLNLMGRWHSI